MKKKKKNKELVRNLVRISLILLLSLLVTVTLCRKEAKANNKILEQTVSDAFTFQNIMMIHALEPNALNEYTDISTLEEADDTESFVSDTAIKTGTSQYYIRVNYGANCVTILTKDEEGNYTKPYKSMICSSGKSTPKSGTYKISYKYRWLSLYGGVYGQYSTRIVKNILFHSVPYYQQRADTLEYEEYDKLGTTASAGCIRLTVQDAKWIYDNITSGTYVEFYSDTTNPGPLGKPKAQKISDNEKNRGWDPTDPDPNNPWNGGSGIPTITYTPKTYTQTTNTNKKKSTEQENTTTEVTHKEPETTKTETTKVNTSKDTTSDTATSTTSSSTKQEENTKQDDDKETDKTADKNKDEEKEDKTGTTTEPSTTDSTPQPTTPTEPEPQPATPTPSQPSEPSSGTESSSGTSEDKSSDSSSESSDSTSALSDEI